MIFSLIYTLATAGGVTTEPKTSNKNGEERKCVVITRTEGKKLVWVRFLQNFLPAVLCTTTKDSCRSPSGLFHCVFLLVTHFVSGNFRVFCVTFRELGELSSQFSKNKPCLIVVDETSELDRELDSRVFKSITARVPFVFSCDSSGVSLLDDLQYFHKLVTLCGRELSYADSSRFVNEFCSRRKREKLRDFIRSFYLEHFWNEIKDDNVPYETRELNQTIFDENNTETSQSQETQIFDCDTVRFIPLEKDDDAKVKAGEDYTCNMPPLQFDSKSDTSQNIYDADTQPYIPDVEHTPQSTYGQEMKSTYSGSIDFAAVNVAPSVRDANVTEDLFADNSIELEEVKATPEVIVISSGSTLVHTRCSSPDDLFSDNDDHKAEPVAEASPPHVSSLPVIKALERCNTKISTPIAQLVSGVGFQDSESPIGFLSPNFWGEAKQLEQAKAPTDESVFEITKNDVFPNVLRVNENNEISPVSLLKEKQRPLPKFDWSAFMGSSEQGASAQKSSPNKEVEPHLTPNTPNKSNVDLDKSNHSSQLRTPTSKRSTSPSPCSSRSSRKAFKTGGGWLNKYSPVVAPKTPKTPKNRRKKLESLFNDIPPSSQNDAQDWLMSPNDLFE